MKDAAISSEHPYLECIGIFLCKDNVFKEMDNLFQVDSADTKDIADPVHSELVGTHLQRGQEVPIIHGGYA